MDPQLPNFLCVGTAKAGTSTLFRMLQQHPNVFVPERKELHYFDQINYSVENESLYRAFFQKADSLCKIRADFTPGYLYVEETPDRILNLLEQDVKILIILRNPVDRAFSHYMMAVNYGEETKSFEESFLLEPTRLLVDFETKMRSSYFDRGFYSVQVRRYLDRFKNVKIVLFEDFIYKNDIVMQEIFEFLEIEHCRLELMKSNEGGIAKSLKFARLLAFVKKILSKSSVLKRCQFLKKIRSKLFRWNKNILKKCKVDPVFAQKLQDYYYEDICALETLIGKDLSDWKNKYTENQRINMQ